MKGFWPVFVNSCTLRFPGVEKLVTLCHIVKGITDERLLAVLADVKPIHFTYRSLFPLCGTSWILFSFLFRSKDVRSTKTFISLA